MILQTGFRTDIPGFYSTWFANRLRAGFVLVRNPYDPQSVTRYAINPDVVDLIGFCTKNPAPMLPRMELLRPYGQYWFVTITPYGPEIEPHVPPKAQVLQDFITLSKIVGPDCIAWRYDPIFLSDTYTAARHIAEFEQMASALSGYTRTCVISFIDLYEKVRRNFPQVNASRTQPLALVRIQVVQKSTLRWTPLVASSWQMPPAILLASVWQCCLLKISKKSAMSLILKQGPKLKFVLHIPSLW
jgi:hypothetical protein